jgi:murein DD-endopeptidase MepM/ murein hydrolase activator NlpD
MGSHASLPHRHRNAAQPGIVHLSRRTLLGASVAAAAIFAWAGAATWYIASHDELAERVFVRETEMKYAYEDRLAHLSTHLEREVTQNLVERRGFDARIAAIAARQAEIESRQAWLRAAAEQAGLAGSTNSVTVVAGTPDRRAGPKSAPTANDRKPAPFTELDLRLGGERSPSTAQPPRDRLSSIEGKLEATAAQEIEITKAMGQAARSRVSRLRSVLDATGLDLAPPPGAARGTGGPLVPLELKPGSGPIGFLFADLGSSLSEIRRLDAIARTLPLAAPLGPEAEQTSGFGTRFDPFTRGPALHTGVDFRAETGTPARAAGAGRVLAAEYSGGYGNMVDIDHGNGVVTRYGHLTAFVVAPGERVQAGQTIGLTGSTGRSTGPHLHYEIRVAASRSIRRAFSRLASSSAAARSDALQRTRSARPLRKS